MPAQHRLHGHSQVDKNPDEAPRPRQLDCLLQHDVRLAGFPLGIQRQGAQGQDLDLIAGGVDPVSDLIQDVQNLLRLLQVSWRASGQQDPRPGDLWFFQPQK
jgi:hypothetical protein